MPFGEVVSVHGAPRLCTARSAVRIRSGFDKPTVVGPAITYRIVGDQRYGTKKEPHQEGGEV